MSAQASLSLSTGARLAVSDPFLSALLPSLVSRMKTPARSTSEGTFGSEPRIACRSETDDA
jgi:hypothetical protein